MFIKVERVEGNDLPLPTQATHGSSGIDLVYAGKDDKVIVPGQRAVIPTGIKMAIPSGFEAQVRSRSGLAANKGVMVLNSPGTIDADYRGEIGVILMNFGSELFVVRRGDRIAQLVVSKVERVQLIEEGKLGKTDRGAGGFGSTGIKSYDVVT
jgi:dUTP pyrophosphatase